MKTLAAHLVVLTIAGAISAQAALAAAPAPKVPDQEVALLKLEIKQLEAVKRERSRAVRLEKLQARKAKLEAEIAAAGTPSTK